MEKARKGGKAKDRRPSRIGVPDRATHNRAKRIIRGHGLALPSIPGKLNTRDAIMVLARKLDKRARLMVRDRKAYREGGAA